MINIEIPLSKLMSNKLIFDNKDGDYFRLTFLMPVFDKGQKGIVNLDDMYGIPYWFVYDAFVKLLENYTLDEINNTLSFVCTDEPPLIDTIQYRLKTGLKEKKD